MQDVFQKYNDITVNFTILSVIHPNTSFNNLAPDVTQYDLALAMDALKLIQTGHTMINASSDKLPVDHFYRNELNRAIRLVSGVE